MKTAILILALLVTTGAMAQGVTSGPKTAVVTGSTMQLTPLDTVAIYNRGRASVVCPPGTTPADSIRIFRRGQNQRPTQVIFDTPDSSYVLK